MIFIINMFYRHSCITNSNSVGIDQTPHSVAFDLISVYIVCHCLSYMMADINGLVKQSMRYFNLTSSKLFRNKIIKETE